ncbi:hypothetical protein ACETU7_09660 [Rhodococcus sp. 3Y1]
MTTREDGRADDELRTVKITRGFTSHPAGSVLVEFGNTRVMCTASVEGCTPLAQGLRLGLADSRIRDASRRHAHTQWPRIGQGQGRRPHAEISRLIGRSLRACIDLAAIGENTIALDCDVLQADGGTRTAAVTGHTWPWSTP